jgi:hypothetical protein
LGFITTVVGVVMMNEGSSGAPSAEEVGERDDGIEVTRT